MRSEQKPPSGPFTGDEADEYDHIASGLKKAVKTFREYMPIVDDLSVDAVARYTIHMKRLDKFIESDTATEHTYSRVIDSQVKLAKMIDDALYRLAVTGQDKITNQKESEISQQFKETLRRLQNARERNTSS